MLAGFNGPLDLPKREKNDVKVINFTVEQSAKQLTEKEV
jgi:hypothetical protein